MHTAVIGLGFGDEGKGSVVDRLCARGDVEVVVRFNGGCQTAHNVVTNDGRHHTFAQFGSGTFQGVRTYLSRHMLVEPLSLMIEADHLATVGIADPYALLSVAWDAKVTTPYHWLVNRYQEDQRGDSRHGSCGRGIGATVEYAQLDEDFAPIVDDLEHPRAMELKLIKLQRWMQRRAPGVDLPDIDRLLQDYAQFVRRVRVAGDLELMDYKRIVFEGAQGVLLDEHVGFHPYTTWSTVTPTNVRSILTDYGVRGDLEVLGVTRAYSTRHGAGPFVPEDNTLRLPEAHNQVEHYQGAWRVGHLDVPALRYAIDACGQVDGLYVTHVDSADAEPALKVCTSYRNQTGADLPRPVLTQHWASSFDVRARQSARLFKTDPVLEDRPNVDWVASVGQLLDRPVRGFGFGPSTSDGAWFSHAGSPSN